MTGRIDMAAISPEAIEATLDVIFAETQQTYPPQLGPRWYQRWVRQGRNRHRATRFSQILAAELIGRPS